MSQEKKVIFGQLGRLKRSKIKEYEELHANPWPQVLQTIHDCNLRNYSIFREGELVFAYFEYVGEDFEADMAKMAADPTTQAWWDIVKPLMEPLADRAEGDFWSDMDEVYHLN